MLIFSTPKPFLGHNATIQKNAIRSWTLLDLAPKVVLIGDEAGIVEAAGELGVENIATVARNEYGTPMLADIFRLGASMSHDNDVLCYINADIILTSDFIAAVTKVAASFRSFLMIGERTDFDLKGEIDFKDGWESALLVDVQTRGRSHGPTGIDYFVFRGSLWDDMPPFALGRTAWDNWLVYCARARGVPVVDATCVVFAIHQDHGYAHVSYDSKGAWAGQEATRNKELAGNGILTITDATHQLLRRVTMSTTDALAGYKLRELNLQPVRVPDRLELRWNRQILLDHDRGMLALNRRRLLHFIRRRRHYFGGILWRALGPFLMK